MAIILYHRMTPMGPGLELAFDESHHEYLDTWEPQEDTGNTLNDFT